jgi:hypothetical protein
MPTNKLLTRCEQLASGSKNISWTMRHQKLLKSSSTRTTWSKPPGNHRRNQAECAIQTFKAHFILILAGVNNKFPLSLWCHLLQPTELTLNLLCQSKVAQKISAFAHVHGPHDFMKKLFAPLGCAIQATSSPTTVEPGRRASQCRVQPWPLHGAPPLLPHLQYKNMFNKNQ